MQAGQQSAVLSNPNIITPYGSQTVNWYGDELYGVQQPTVTQELSPVGQQQFDSQNRIINNLNTTAESGLGRINDAMSTPFDMGQVTDYSVDPGVAGREQVVQAMLDRNQPIMDRQRELKENDLLIQGHNRGGEAWNAVQDDMARSENDARLAAILAGGTEQSRLAGLESARRAQDIQEQSYLRNIPLSEVNALRTGGQPNMPTFQAYQGGNIAAAPIMDAALAKGNMDMQRYQQQAANRAGTMGGLFDLGGAFLGMPGASKMFGF